MEVRNLWRKGAVDLALLRRIVRTFLQDLATARNFELSLCLVTAAEITWLNETFLHHRGATDVICLDYGSETGNPERGQRKGRKGQRSGTALLGEIFVCPDEAVRQAKRYRTTWQSELVRYIVHGVLHLCGHDDAHSGQRRLMKRAEDRVLKKLAGEYRFERLSRKVKVRIE